MTTLRTIHQLPADQIKALKALITSQNHRIEWLEGKAGRVDELASTIVQLEASVRAVAFNQKLVKWGGVSDAEQMVCDTQALCLLRLSTRVPLLRLTPNLPL